MRNLALLAITCLGLCLSTTAKADKLDDMISPISNPVNFEDPRSRSEIRPIFVYHKIDKKFATNGGNIRIFALQARYAVNDRFSIIATKDGYIDSRPNAVFNHEKGFGNVGGGVKYAFYKDGAAGEIATAGLRYEAPVGEQKVFMGRGDGSLNPFLSGAMNLGSVNMMAATGIRWALDNKDSSFYDLDVHFDTQMGCFYPTVEFNLVHVLDAGKRLGIPDEGQDFFNFGSTLSDGKTIVTAAVGARVKLSDDILFGAAYQFPLTSGAGSHVTDWRLTSDLIFTF